MNQDVQGVHSHTDVEITMNILHKYSALEILERINAGEKTELVDPSEGDRPSSINQNGINITKI